MTIEVTKVWIENNKMFALQIPEAEIYKREWADLTDLEIWKIYRRCHDELTRPPSEDFAFKFAGAIGVAIKEKNT